MGDKRKMTEEELEREYYGRRPTEPYSEDDSPNDWANIMQYAEENLGKAFKAIAELEREKCELLGIIQGKDKVIQELEKENTGLSQRILKQQKTIGSLTDIIDELKAQIEKNEVLSEL